MPTRARWFLAIAVLSAAIMVRLGFWQLDRLAQRRARNAAVAARLAEPPTTLAALPADTGARRYRRVAVAGVPLYDREVRLVNRSRDGSPGVNIVTPVRVAGRDTLVMLNRGWIYSANGTDLDLARWHEGDSLAVTGYVEIPSRRPGPAAVRSPRAFRWYDADSVGAAVGAPVTPYYVVAEAPPGETKPPLDRPVRIPPPALDEGNHQSYAIQWFSFATIALVGTWAFLRADGRRRAAGVSTDGRVG